MSFHIPASGEDASPVRRTWWTCKIITSEYGAIEERTRVEKREEALLIASLTENGWHAPALDFDFRVESLDLGGHVTRLRFPGLHVRPRPWRKLLAHLAGIGLVSGDLKRHQDAFIDPKETALHIDFVAPVRALPSSSEGHHHVYIDVEMPWKAYRALCKRMQKAGLLEPGYLRISEARGMTMLIRPGLTKSSLIAEGRMLDRGAKRDPAAADGPVLGGY